MKKFMQEIRYVLAGALMLSVSLAPLNAMTEAEMLAKGVVREGVAVGTKTVAEVALEQAAKEDAAAIEQLVKSGKERTVAEAEVAARRAAKLKPAVPGTHPSNLEVKTLKPEGRAPQAQPTEARATTLTGEGEGESVTIPGETQEEKLSRMQRAKNWVREHPYKTAGIATGVAVGGTAIGVGTYYAVKAKQDRDAAAAAADAQAAQAAAQAAQQAAQQTSTTPTDVTTVPTEEPTEVEEEEPTDLEEEGEEPTAGPHKHKKGAKLSRKAHRDLEKRERFTETNIKAKAEAARKKAIKKGHVTGKQPIMKRETETKPGMHHEMSHDKKMAKKPGKKPGKKRAQKHAHKKMEHGTTGHETTGNVSGMRDTSSDMSDDVSDMGDMSDVDMGDMSDDMGDMGDTTVTE